MAIAVWLHLALEVHALYLTTFGLLLRVALAGLAGVLATLLLVISTLRLLLTTLRFLFGLLRRLPCLFLGLLWLIGLLGWCGVYLLCLILG